MAEKKKRTRTRANGTGTAVWHHNSWQAKVVISWKLSKDGDGCRKLPVYRTKSGFQSKKDALNFCTQLLAGYEKPEVAPTLEHYWNIYKENDLPKISNSKQCAYKIAWGRLDKLQFRKMDTLTVEDLKQSIKGLTYYPARDIKTVFSHLFKLAGADGWVNKDLPDYIELPKLQESEQTPFNEKEQKALWKLYDDGNDLAAIPLVMIYTGMMPGEAMKLTCEMVDLKKKVITGVGSKTEIRKKSDIYLSISIIPVLQDLTEGKTGKIWRYNKDNFYKIYYDVLEKAGTRKLPPYSCRHTTATALAIDKNIAPQTIKKIMRWSTTKMLDRYAHPDQQDIISAVDAI